MSAGSGAAGCAVAVVLERPPFLNTALTWYNILLTPLLFLPSFGVAPVGAAVAGELMFS